MKARCSVGLTLQKYLGSFGESNEQTIELSTLDADKSIGFLVTQDTKLTINEPAYLQFAVLYTTATSERKIRVFNYSINVSDQLSTLLL